MSQMAEASSEMLEALPSIFPNFGGYFLLGEAHHFFRKYMGKSKHSILNTEEVVHPTTIANKWWDTDQQLVAVRQACQALSVATGLDFHHSNIKNFDDVMPVSAAMKRKSEERLDAAIRREEEEEEERLDAAIRRVEKEEVRLDAAIRRREDEEERLDAAICRVEEEEERLLDLDAAIRSFEEEMNREMKEAAAAEAAAAAAAQWKAMKETVAAAVVATAAKRKEMKEAAMVAVAAGVSVKAAVAVKRKAFLEFAGRYGASLGGTLCYINNPTLRLFSHTCLHISRTCLHTTSDDNQTRRHKSTNNRQTPPPWWSRSPLQRHGFDEPKPPEGWAALRMFVPPMSPSKRLNRFHKFK